MAKKDEKNLGKCHNQIKALRKCFSAVNKLMPPARKFKVIPMEKNPRIIHSFIHPTKTRNFCFRFDSKLIPSLRSCSDDKVA